MNCRWRVSRADKSCDFTASAIEVINEDKTEKIIKLGTCFIIIDCYHFSTVISNDMRIEKKRLQPLINETVEEAEAEESERSKR